MGSHLLFKKNTLALNVEDGLGGVKIRRLSNSPS